MAVWLIRAGKHGERQNLAHYDSFSEELKADLPLKKIWALVQEET